jgi:hypothetical protein
MVVENMAVRVLHSTLKKCMPEKGCTSFTRAMAYSTSIISLDTPHSLLVISGPKKGLDFQGPPI